MNDTLKTTYGGVEIVYRDAENDWLFTLRGRERTASSLQLAKDAIDKPETKKNEFKRFTAFLKDYSCCPWQVEVTGTAARSRWETSPQAWVQNEDLGRRKVKVSDLFVFDDSSVKIVAEWEDLRQQADELNKKAIELTKGLKPLPKGLIPEEE